ncbi:nuclear transport factor 2 family protein [Nocardioides sp. YIM 152588]|uniref:nuclear transport factor 2 family protein n=1 Tax=Nocardioides sp. YIM 152588 TaxID=3158259 RepID=UPI0032E45C77
MTATGATGPAEVVRAFYAAIEAGRHGEDLAGFLAPDARTVERPNALVPGGRVSGRAEMLAASTAGAGLLAGQRYDVASVVESGDLVVTRLRWTGVVARSVGPFAEGQTLTAQIAQFVRVTGGLISEIETYDCYEPFDGG